jgi:hypothetical protein
MARTGKSSRRRERYAAPRRPKGDANQKRTVKRGKKSTEPFTNVVTWGGI